jgi:hypothetical protein
VDDESVVILDEAALGRLSQLRQAVAGKTAAPCTDPLEAPYSARKIALAHKIALGDTLDLLRIADNMLKQSPAVQLDGLTSRCVVVWQPRCVGVGV